MTARDLAATARQAMLFARDISDDGERAGYCDEALVALAALEKQAARVESAEEALRQIQTVASEIRGNDDLGVMYGALLGIVATANAALSAWWRPRGAAAGADTEPDGT